MKKERVVVKIGSSSLTNQQGSLSREKLKQYADEIIQLRQAGNEVVLISSGAVAAGFYDLGYPSRPVTTAGKQAAAAVGQSQLMQAYNEEFSRVNIACGQLLLTRENFANHSQYQNAHSTITELLHRQVLPIINENDSIAVDELTFGDNDMLSALVAGLVHADTLLILTDINGIYDKNPNEDQGAKKYHFIPAITNDLMDQAGETSSSVGTGGMRSKLKAAGTALRLGTRVFVGRLSSGHRLEDVLSGKGDGTYIGVPGGDVLNNKKQWIGLHSVTAGAVVVDDGAAKALLRSGKSLLPAGIVDVQGHFSAGNVVDVFDQKDNLLGRGQVNMSAEELQAVKGKSTAEAASFTSTSKSEVIHRDNWITTVRER
ncbi:glutamate 5-kinase [Marinococcus halophilus]|uniref:glutamate 5-kinase n=1 Tax=Marinococcus halophilus TaxID=1371 RepID=UPI0009A9130C|nr:glutamate 5-kinase [Marinococcus halophilus]